MTDDRESALEQVLEARPALRWVSAGVVAVVYLATARIGLSLFAVNGVAMGDLVVAPALLVWSMPSRWPVQLRRRPAETPLILGMVAVVSEIIFVRVHGSTAQYAVFPFLVWAALRTGQPAVAPTVLVI